MMVFRVVNPSGLRASTRLHLGQQRTAKNAFSHLRSANRRYCGTNRPSSPPKAARIFSTLLSAFARNPFILPCYILPDLPVSATEIHTCQKSKEEKRDGRTKKRTHQSTRTKADKPNSRIIDMARSVPNAIHHTVCYSKSST